MLARTYLLGTFFLPSALVAAQSNVRPLPSAALPTPGLGLSGWASALAIDDLSAVPRAGEEHGSFQLRFEGWLDAPAGFSDAAGELSSQRGGWSAAIGRETRGGRVWSARLESEATFYKFSGAGGIVPGSGAPFNDVYRTSAGASWLSSREAELAGFLGAAVSVGGEDGADLGESFFAGALAGLRYVPRDDVALSFGVQAQTQLEDDAWLAPFLGVELQLTEDLQLSLEGSRLSLEQRLSESWSLRGEAGYETRQYRLNDGPLPDGVFRDERIDVRACVAWRNRRGFELELGVGTSPWRELTFLDRGGSLVNEVEVDPGLSGSFALRIAF